MTTDAPRFSKSILLIEDDTELCALMTDFFAQHGFRVESVHDGRSGLARGLEGDYDLILLDVMLPVLDGFDILTQIRKRRPIPIIMLTARTTPDDRVAGLEGGADDYISKPFGPEELLARIRAVLRRAGNPDVARQQVFRAGGIKLNSHTREVWKNGIPVEVTSIEFDILEHLVHAIGRTVTRNELAAILYQRSATPFERSIDVHISHLRKKLESQSDVVIGTVRGVGYLLSVKSESGE
jgi:two-component system response regulator CpxR